MTVSAIPAGYSHVSPYLIGDDAAATLAFMTQVFEGELLGQQILPDGRITHAEVRIGGSVVMVGGASPQGPAVPAGLHIYVRDVDATYAAAIDAGAKSVSAPETKPYGDRSAHVTDTRGTIWFISTHVEDVPADGLARRISDGGA